MHLSQRQTITPAGIELNPTTEPIDEPSKDKEIEKKLSDDVIEMEKMLNEYLQFSSNRSNEKSENFDISDLVSKTVSKYETKKIFFENWCFNFRANAKDVF